MSEQGDDLAKAKATYLHHDPRIGSVAAVTDPGGALKEAFYYEPFGQRTDAHGKPLTSSPSEVRAGFTGHEHDDDLGLINMRGRMFDPVLRRFLSPDTHVTNPLLGQSYNRYSYVLDNPTNLIDPTGFDCIGQECSGGGSEYSSSGFKSTYGNDYSSVFTRVDTTPSAPSGFSGSAVGGNGAGAPVQAAERQRLVSMPTGPSAPAGAISGPTVNAGADADKWNPYSAEGRIRRALLGSEPPWQDPLEPYGPALASIGVSFIPGLNSYMVLNDPEASTASKVLAVGTDVLSVVGVGGVIKFAKAAGALVKGVSEGAKAAEGLEVVRAYSVAFETTLVERGIGEYNAHFAEANEQLLKAMLATGQVRQSCKRGCIRRRCSKCSGAGSGAVARGHSATASCDSPSRKPRICRSKSSGRSLTRPRPRSDGSECPPERGGGPSENPPRPPERRATGSARFQHLPTGRTPARSSPTRRPPARWAALKSPIPRPPGGRAPGRLGTPAPPVERPLGDLRTTLSPARRPR